MLADLVHGFEQLAHCYHRTKAEEQATQSTPKNEVTYAGRNVNVVSLAISGYTAGSLAPPYDAVNSKRNSAKQNKLNKTGIALSVAIANFIQIFCELADEE